MTRHDPRIPQVTINAVYERARNYVTYDEFENQPVCEECLRPDAPLEMHHLTYSYTYADYKPWKYEEPIYGHETPDDLMLLCRDCHHDRHLGPCGEFYCDPEEAENQRDWWDYIISKERPECETCGAVGYIYISQDENAVTHELCPKCDKARKANQ